MILVDIILPEPLEPAFIVAATLTAHLVGDDFSRKWLVSHIQAADHCRALGDDVAQKLRFVRSFADQIRHDVGDPYQLFDRGVEVRDVGGQDIARGRRAWGVKVRAESESEFGLLGGRVGKDLGRPGKE